MHQFETKIQGIPCICQVTRYSPAIPMKVYGSGFGDCHPPEPGEFEYSLLDRKGYPAGWLENKVEEKDEIRLKTEFLSLAH